MFRVPHRAVGFMRVLYIGLALGVMLLVGGVFGAYVVESQELPLKRRKLSIGGALVDALADFQRIGGEVDEVTPEELAKKGPKTVGQLNGRSIFAVPSGEPGKIVGIVSADGGAIKASITSKGFLQLQPASSGFRTRNIELFKALYPDKKAPAYTEEILLEYIDDSGARLMLGGAETDKTTAFLFKKDPETGEIIFKIRRDILKEKSTEGYLDPDVSSTFPTTVKICDVRRANCETRTIIKKPGDEIRLDPLTRHMNIVFNKDNLSYSKKFRSSQRLSWACEYQGRGFFITYREGSLGGFRKPGRNDIGTLSCINGVLRCERSAPGQKCNFDFRDYLAKPAEAALFGLDWLLARKDPHTHYFTLAPDPSVKRHIRIGNLKNLESIQEVAHRGGVIDHASDIVDAATDGGAMDSWVTERLQKALCAKPSAACTGTPEFKVLEVTSVNDGLFLIDERTGTKLKNVERVRLYSLRQPYGWGKQGDFIATLITNKRGAAEVAALERLNEELEAPLFEDMVEDQPSDPVKAMLKGLEDEAKWETRRVKLDAKTHALVIFPTTHVEDMKGYFGLPVKQPPPVPAQILSLNPDERASAARHQSPSRSPRRPLPPVLPPSY